MWSEPFVILLGHDVQDQPVVLVNEQMSVPYRRWHRIEVGSDTALYLDHVDPALIDALKASLHRERAA